MHDKASATNLGTVVSVRGSVVDIRFDGHLPPIYSVLRAGAEQKIVIEVLWLAKTPPFSEGEGRTDPGERDLRGDREVSWCVPKEP